VGVTWLTGSVIEVVNLVTAKVARVGQGSLVSPASEIWLDPHGTAAGVEEAEAPGKAAGVRAAKHRVTYWRRCCCSTAVRDLLW
jgi:hypothetical protein